MTGGRPHFANPKLADAARQAARLAAVQAIYQMEQTALGAEEVIAEFLEFRFTPDPELATRGNPDAVLFADIVRGVPHHQVEIDRAIVPCLSDDWTFARIDSILRAILRAGAFELIVNRNAPATALIDEYVDITHAFFQGDEPKFVNAALDKLARTKRAAEFTRNDEPRS